MPNEPVEPTSSDELLDLISKLDAFLRVVTVVTMVEAELVGIALPEVRAHPLWPWELFSDLHQHLGFRCIEGGIVVEPSWGRPHRARCSGLPCLHPRGGVWMRLCPGGV